MVKKNYGIFGLNYELCNFIHSKETCTLKDILTEFQSNDNPETNIGTSTIKDHLTELVKAEFIHRIGRGEYQADLFRHPDPKVQKKHFKQFTEESESIQELCIQRNEHWNFIERIKQNTNIKVDFGRKIVLSDRFNDLLLNHLRSLLVECFCYNPDVWGQYRSANEMRFSITIDANWNDDPKIFTFMQDYKKLCLDRGLLILMDDPNCSIQYGSDEGSDFAERSKIIGHRTIKEFYDQANSESLDREERIRREKEQFQQLKPLFVEAISNEATKWKENRDRIAKLEELRRSIEKDQSVNILKYYPDNLEISNNEPYMVYWDSNPILPGYLKPYLITEKDCPKTLSNDELLHKRLHNQFELQVEVARKIGEKILKGERIQNEGNPRKDREDPKNES